MLNRRHFFKASAGLLSAAGLTNARASAPAFPPSIVDEVVPTKEKPLRLNFNENSLGMAPSAKKAVAGILDEGCRYPMGEVGILKADIARVHGFAPEDVMLGVGSSEVIKAIFDSQVEAARHAGKKVQLVEPWPTFAIAKGYAASFHVPVVDVPLDPETLLIDMARMKAAVEAFDGVSIVYFCNPNNPTATVTPKAELSGWIRACAAEKAPVFFLVDEAYAEFVQDPAFESGYVLVREGLANLAVARTFSKLYAMAGMRLGYGIAAPSVLSECEKFLCADGMNYAAVVAGIATINDKAYLDLSLSAMNLSRAIVTKALDELGIRWLPSNANFIFHELKGETAEYQKRMAERFVKVGRPFPPCTTWNRLSLGTPGEMKAFVKVLKDFRAMGWV